jgi:hypothetical protein
MSPMKKALMTLAIVGIVFAAGYFVYVTYVPTDDGYIPPEPGNDTDNDGLPDTWEMQYWGNLAQTATGDPDNDGFTNLQEYENVTNPTVSDLVPTPDLDTDDDGLPDTWEIQYFGDLDETANGDVDNDGFTNAEEYANGTNPTVSDATNTYPFVEGWNVPGNVNYIVISGIYNIAFFDQTYGLTTYNHFNTLTELTAWVTHIYSVHGRLSTQQYDCGMAQIISFGG